MDNTQPNNIEPQQRGAEPSNHHPEGLRVIFRSEAYAEIMRGARISTPEETVGALIGTVQDDIGWKLIDIEEASQIKLTASRSGLAPGQRELQEIKAGLAARDGKHLQIVGWYYTHPADEVDGSDIDVGGLERVFGSHTLVTLLADPAQGQGVFYARKDGRFAPMGDFSVAETDGEMLPGVIWSGALLEGQTTMSEPERTAGAAYTAQAATPGRVDVRVRRASARWRMLAIAALVLVAFGLGLWQGSAFLGRGVHTLFDTNAGKNMESSSSLSIATLEVSARATAQVLKLQPTQAPLVLATETTEEDNTATPSPVPSLTLTPSPTYEPPAKTIVLSTELTHTLLLEDTDFTGGYTPENGKYRDRTARYLYGQGTSFNSAIGKFNLNLQVIGAPVRWVQVTLVGLASQSTNSIPLRIELNGTAIFEGPDPFPGDLGPSLPGAGNWGTFTLSAKPELLRQGPNTLAITNLAGGGQVGSAPFVVIDRAAIAWSTTPH